MAFISAYQSSILFELYDYNRIPLWLFDEQKKVSDCYFSKISQEIQNKLTLFMNELIMRSSHPDFDIICYENELYYIFSFECKKKTGYIIGGPMLLGGFFHITQMRSLSFADHMQLKELRTLVENIPVISFTTFSSCLRIMMLLLKKEAPSIEEIREYKFSDYQGSLNQTFIHQLFENTEESRIHTPYCEELAVLSCVRDGDVTRLESTYKALPETKYGNMSNNPLKQLFYGCIANTTLVTRFAIEGGMEEESALTLSDVYIKQMEHCKTLYELNVINEKMAVDFTKRVAKAKKSIQPVYSKAVTKCMNYIERNIHKKLTLEMLACEVNLTPKYLSNLFCKETGSTITAFIEQKKIQEAKNMLLYSSYPLSHISQYLGFSSQSYFTCVFRKETGMTPKQFRETSP